MVDTAQVPACGPSPQAALTMRGVTVSAATKFGRFNVIEDLDLDLPRGCITGLVGESGSGKSVTALTAMQLLPEPALRLERGSIRLGDLELSSLGGRGMRAVRGTRIAMVFQEPMTSLDPVFKIGGLITEVLRAHRKISRREARRRAVELLTQVGIPAAASRLDDYPFQFSGGMRQRVLIAMAMACGPEVLIADEPTTALDVTVQAQILDLLRSIAAERELAILLVTHDLGVVSEYCDRVAVMYAGQIVERGPTHSVLAGPAHPYTAALLAAVPSVDCTIGSLATIDGAVPSLDAMPAGCRFAPRCGHRRDVCLEPVPLLGLGADREQRCARHGQFELAGIA